MVRQGCKMTSKNTKQENGVEVETIQSNRIRPIKITAVGDGMVGKTCLLITYVSKRFPTEYVPTVFDNYADNITVDGQDFNMTLWDTAGQEDYERLRPLSYPNTDCFLLCYSVSSRTSYENVVSKWCPELKHHMPHVPIVLVECLPRFLKKLVVEILMYYLYTVKLIGKPGKVTNDIREDRAALAQTDEAKDSRKLGSLVAFQFQTIFGFINIGTKIDLRDEEPECISYAEGKKLKQKIRAARYVECSAIKGEGLQEVFTEAIRAVMKKPPTVKRACSFL